MQSPRRGSSLPGAEFLGSSAPYFSEGLLKSMLRMGVDELSMNAKSVLPVRKIIRSIDLSKPSDK